MLDRRTREGNSAEPELGDDGPTREVGARPVALTASPTARPRCSASTESMRRGGKELHVGSCSRLSFCLEIASRTADSMGSDGMADQPMKLRSALALAIGPMLPSRMTRRCGARCCIHQEGTADIEPEVLADHLHTSPQAGSKALKGHEYVAPAEGGWTVHGRQGLSTRFLDENPTPEVPAPTVRVRLPARPCWAGENKRRSSGMRSQRPLPLRTRA